MFNKNEKIIIGDLMITWNISKEIIENKGKDISEKDYKLQIAILTNRIETLREEYLKQGGN